MNLIDLAGCAFKTTKTLRLLLHDKIERDMERFAQSGNIFLLGAFDNVAILSAFSTYLQQFA